MAKRDFYEILGIGKNAGDDEIKSAYRKLARQYHPDVNKATDAPKKFNEVQEAYDTLSDSSKRRMYDVYGHDMPSGGAGESGGPGSRSSNPWSGSPAGGVKINLEDLGSVFDTFFGDAGGSGFRGGAQASGNARGGRRGGASGGGAARGRANSWGDETPSEVHHEVLVDFLTAARGGTERLRLSIGEQTRTIEVAIPKGIVNGAKLRVRGGAGENDLILTVKVGGHPLWRRGGDAASGEAGYSPLDLILDLPLDIAEATLGATVTVPTLDGNVELAVPAGSSSGKKLRLKGRGIVDAQGTKGDLYAIIKILTPAPDSLSASERDILRAIAQRQRPPRSGEGWPT